jgi:hypothetical protein
MKLFQKPKTIISKASINTVGELLAAKHDLVNDAVDLRIDTEERIELNEENIRRLQAKSIDLGLDVQTITKAFPEAV